MGAVLAPGQRIGRYQLLFRLGKGGMGEVWAAGRTQAEFGFQKLVALKVLETSDMASNAAVMFFDEAKAASALQHQAIVNTTDLGRDGDVLYIAMDLVRGPSLTALLQRLVITQKTMSPATVAHIGIKIASALAYAHDRAMVNGQALKLVHRDVSPHNVLIDLNGAVRLTDFGVARTAIQDHESRVGTVRGKPSYMAPEQVVGGKIDGRTDVFALGIVLYECSCLKRLFGRSQPVKSMDAVMKHQPKPLPDLVPDFPQTLWAVIRKALQKNPRDRFQSADELCGALGNAATGLEGFDGAGRDLIGLVGQVFEADAFETDARVREALAQAAPTAEEAEPTTNGRPPEEGEEIQIVGAPRESTAAWPSAEGSDPLDPENIEIARTAYRAISSPAAITPGPVVMMNSGSMEALIPAQTHQSFSGIQPQPQRRNSLAATLVTVAALALVGTTAYVIGRRPAPIPAEIPQSTAEVSPTPSAAPKPGATARQRATPKPPPPTELKPARTEPAPAPERAVRRAPTKRPKTEAAAPAKPADATYGEVLALVRRVKKVDPKVGSSLFATLIEVGRDNPDPKKLNRLRREAQRILSASAAN